MRKIIRGFGCSGMVAVLATGATADVIDRVLAVVSSHAVLESDVRAARELRLIDVEGTGDPVRVVLNAIIDRWLMLAEVERYAPPEPGEAAIDRALQTIRDRFTSADAYQNALARAGATEAHLRGRLRDDLRIATYLEQRFTRVPPAEEAIQAHYRANAERFTTNGRVAPLAEVVNVVTDEVTAMDRQLRITQWVDGLRQRAQIIDRYGEPRIPSP